MACYVLLLVYNIVSKERIKLLLSPENNLYMFRVRVARKDCETRYFTVRLLRMCEVMNQFYLTLAVSSSRPMLRERSRRLRNIDGLDIITDDQQEVQPEVRCGPNPKLGGKRIRNKVGY